MASCTRKDISLKLPTKGRYFTPKERILVESRSKFKNSAFSRDLAPAGNVILRRHDSAKCKKYERRIDRMDEWLSIIDEHRRNAGITPDRDASTLLSSVYLHRAICANESHTSSDRIKRTLAEAYYLLYLASKGKELPMASPDATRLIMFSMAVLDENINTFRREGLLDSTAKFFRSIKKNSRISNKEERKFEGVKSELLREGEWETMPGMNILGMSKTLLQRMPKECFPRVEIAPGTLLKGSPSIDFQQNLEIKIPEKSYSRPGFSKRVKPDIIAGVSKMSLSAETNENDNENIVINLQLSDNDEGCVDGVAESEELNQESSVDSLLDDQKGNSVGQVFMLKEHAQEMLSSCDPASLLLLQNDQTIPETASIDVDIVVDVEFGAI